jgi:hypothetical protein
MRAGCSIPGQLESMADTIELLVSELVTNAINATGITDENPAEAALSAM